MASFTLKKAITIIAVCLLFVLVFAGGYFMGRSRSDGGKDTGNTTAEGLQRFADPSAEKEETGADVTVPVGEIKIDTAPEEPDGETFTELTEENAIVSTGSGLYSYDDMIEDMYALCGKYPELLTYQYIGTSFDGRDIYCMNMGRDDAPHNIFAVAAMNGSEYMTSMLVMKLFEYYAYNYDHGSYEGVPFSELFSQTSIRALVMANPDGVTISQSGTEGLNNKDFAEVIKSCYERDKWYLEYTENDGRKQWVDHYATPEFNVLLAENPSMITFEEYTGIWNANAYGVCVDRNFDVRWGSITMKPEQSYDGFMGTGALTEVETALVYSSALDRYYDYYINYSGKAKAVDNEDDAGTFRAFVREAFGKECIEAYCPERQAPYTRYDFESMYEQNKDEWAHLAYIAENEQQESEE